MCAVLLGVIFKMFLGQNNHNTKINKRFEGSHESLFTEQFLYLSYKLFKPSNTRDEGRGPSRLERFLVSENEGNVKFYFNKN